MLRLTEVTERTSCARERRRRATWHHSYLIQSQSAILVLCMLQPPPTRHLGGTQNYDDFPLQLGSEQHGQGQRCVDNGHHRRSVLAN